MSIFQAQIMNTIWLEFVLISSGSFIMVGDKKFKQAEAHETPRHFVKYGITDPYIAYRRPVNYHVSGGPARIQRNVLIALEILQSRE
jgi:hypothetical protein